MSVNSHDQLSSGRPRAGCVVGIAGPSGSGKSTLAENLARRFDGRCVIVSQDWYYKDLSYLPPERREEVNFDQPGALDWNDLVRDLRSLRAGRPVDAPVYDFHTHTRSTAVRRLEPQPLVIVEGILIFYPTELRREMDYKVYLDMADDIRFIRRLQRDMQERGRDVESIIKQYLETVRPMYERFVRPAAAFADICLNTSGPVDLGPVEQRVRALLA